MGGFCSEAVKNNESKKMAKAYQKNRGLIIRHVAQWKSLVQDGEGGMNGKIILYRLRNKRALLRIGPIWRSRRIRQPIEIEIISAASHNKEKYF